MSFFSFGQSAEIDVVLNDAETRKKVEHKTEDGKKDKYFLFYDGETVSGKVNVTLKNPGKRLEHQGIKIEFVGQIGKYFKYSKATTIYTFIAACMRTCLLMWWKSRNHFLGLFIMILGSLVMSNDTA